MKRAAYALGLAVLGTLVLSACGGGGVSLTESEWIVTELNSRPLVAFAPISASFSDELQVSGVAGCNSYSGAYETEGDAISFGLMATTLMACPSEIMDQEVRYLAALDAVTRYAIDGETMTFYGPGDSPLVVFVVESQDLAGTSWDVISYNTGTGAVTSLVADTMITAAFDAEGQVSGITSCNDYSGPYVTDAGTIAIGPLASTKALCDGLMEQESRYLAALESAATYTVTAGRLELRTAEQALAVSMFRSGN